MTIVVRRPGRGGRCSRRSAAGSRSAPSFTHAHFDHVGFAERARRELRVPVYVHENDVPLTRHPWRYDHERARAPYLATQVKALPIVAASCATARSGRHRSARSSATATAARCRPGRPGRRADAGPHARALRPAPARPRHGVRRRRDRDARSLYGPDRPTLVARAATVDSERNLASLDALAATGARPCSPVTAALDARREAAVEARRTPPWPDAQLRRPPRAPGLLLGIGLGGFVDGIVFHQILQWHHMLTEHRRATR